MNGDGIGILKINIVYDNDQKVTLWQMTGDKGDKWSEGRVGFDSKNMTYRIHIVGIRGKNENGDISIDDLSFEETYCDLYPPEVVGELTTTATLPTTTTQKPISDEITCNFDAKNTCGWINDTTAELTWTLNRGSTSSIDTGLNFLNKSWLAIGLYLKIVY